MLGLKFLKRIQEKIYLKIWSQKQSVLAFFKFSSIVVSLFTILSIVFYYGFENTKESHRLFFSILHFSFSFYFVKYIISLLYSFHFLAYIRKTWFEFTVLMFWIINAFLFLFWGIDATQITAYYLKMPQLVDYSILAVQLFFFIVVGVEVSKIGVFFSKFNFGPSGMLLSAFLLMISIGTALLMMPEMTFHGISFIDALFTSTSASCVTGLTVVDVATGFTFKGKIIILILIQLGGINMLSFATFFAFMAHESYGLKYNSFMKNMLDVDKLSSTRSLLKNIVFFSFGLELVGAFLIFMYWQFSNFDSSMQHNIFYAIFHSVSAFNNVGISLWTDGLYDNFVRHSFFVQAVLMVLIFFGGLGFFAIQDMFALSSYRRRKKQPWKGLQLSTRIVLYTSLFLILAGSVVFYFLEYDKSMSNETSFAKVFHSVFQSVSSRTAGFSTVNFSLVTQPTLLFFIILMFIGASPGSTGGGIKTTTFYLLFKLSIATIIGKKHIESGRNSIPFSLIDKATTVFLFAITLIFVSTFLLSITEEGISFIDLLFEEVSAFATCGLSTGITSSLSPAGRIIIIVSMFVGRIGPLTLGIALSRKVMTNKYRYPNANIMVG